MKKIASWIAVTADCYKGLAILTLNTLVILICLQFLVVGFWAIRSTGGFQYNERVIDARERSSYYKSKDWAKRYWDEYALSRTERYQAYTVWRRARFQGKLINIDDRGFRVTPRADCRPESLKVFVFGASQIWGTGVPDWGTIPAYLQTELMDSETRPVCVTNFGESGYVSTQSLSELIGQLQLGNVPDIVILVGGPAEIFSAYQSGKPGLHENFEELARRIESRDKPRLPLALQLIQSSSLFQFVSYQVSRLSTTEPAKFATYETLNIDANSLADSVVKTYVSDTRVISSLSQTYGFQSYFFWSHYISMGKKTLTDEEEDLKRGIDAGYERLSRAVYDAMDGHLLPGRSLTDVFDRCHSLIWIDASHTTAEGNEMIAKRMLQVIREGGKPTSSF